MCPPPLSLLPKMPSDPIFTRWNGSIGGDVTAYPNALMEPLHATFKGHGIVDTDSWFVSDCLHPTAPGHHQIRRMFWKALTGQDGPP
jgi:lysophospholipase L1-like esterase